MIKLCWSLFCSCYNILRHCHICTLENSKHVCYSKAICLANKPRLKFLSTERFTKIEIKIRNGKFETISLYIHVNWRKSTETIKFKNFRQAKISINQFHGTSLFLHPLKTSENQGFLMFSGVQKETTGKKWVKKG